MKAVQIKSYGGNDVVEINQSAPRPSLSAGQVLAQVHAAGINPVDWKVRQGYMSKVRPLSFPATLGGDFSGTIVDVGPGVIGFKKGDDVYGSAFIYSGGSGAFAEFTTADAEHIALKPKSVDHIQAAALPLVGVSAWQGLMDYIHLFGSQKILIHGGAGGIGSVAIQLAKHAGAFIATTVSAKDAAYVKSLGADVIIDYHKQRFENIVHDYDAVFDTVGGDTYERSFPVLKKGGVLVSMLEPPNEALMQKYGVKAILEFTQINTERLSKLAVLVDQGVIRAHIDKTFPLDQARQALAHQQEGRPQGKVDLKVD